MKILGISGSPTAVSRSSWLLQHFLDTLADQHGALDLLDTIRARELPAQALLQADFAHPTLVDAVGRVADADIVVIATPIYKAAYSGLLKVFLDLLPQDGLRGKAVVVLATGGSTAHLLAVDYALKPVLSALGAREILDTVYATDAQLPRHDTLGYSGSADITERLGRVASHVQRRLPPPALQQPLPAAINPFSKRVAPQHPLPRGVRISA
ncbi:MAG TPA: NADPH-dependent FMN reductase [Candidatus Aquabacterium excrementipullorum]|nr:NADPH-dependent FMN reductase [Candidatus Aquabacterium excrementipullorum]